MQLRFLPSALYFLHSSNNFAFSLESEKVSSLRAICQQMHLPLLKKFTLSIHLRISIVLNVRNPQLPNFSIDSLDLFGLTGVTAYLCSWPCNSILFPVSL